jgi:hypothetical protein
MGQQVWMSKAVELGIIFNGMQEAVSGAEWPMFTDRVTQSTFIIAPNETIETELERVRESFK